MHLNSPHPSGSLGQQFFGRFSFLGVPFAPGRALRLLFRGLPLSTRYTTASDCIAVPRPLPFLVALCASVARASLRWRIASSRPRLSHRLRYSCHWPALPVLFAADLSSSTDHQRRLFVPAGGWTHVTAHQLCLPAAGRVTAWPHRGQNPCRDASSAAMQFLAPEILIQRIFERKKYLFFSSSTDRQNL